MNLVLHQRSQRWINLSNCFMKRQITLDCFHPGSRYGCRTRIFALIRKRYWGRNFRLRRRLILTHTHTHKIYIYILFDNYFGLFVRPLNGKGCKGQENQYKICNKQVWENVSFFFFILKRLGAANLIFSFSISCTSWESSSGNSV